MCPSPPIDIGEAARRLGVTAATLRLYERRGLLARTSRSAAGYRKYHAADLQRARLVCRARRLGLSLGQIAQATRAIDDLTSLRALVIDHLSRLEGEIRHRARLRRHLGRWLRESAR